MLSSSASGAKEKKSDSNKNTVTADVTANSKKGVDGGLEAEKILGAKEGEGGELFKWKNSESPISVKIFK